MSWWVFSCAASAISHPAPSVWVIVHRTESRSHPLCGPARERLLQQNNEEIIANGRETCGRGKRKLGKLLIKRVKAREVSGPDWRRKERIDGGHERMLLRWICSWRTDTTEKQEGLIGCNGQVWKSCWQDVSQRRTCGLWFGPGLKWLSCKGSMASCNTAQTTGRHEIFTRQAQLNCASVHALSLVSSPWLDFTRRLHTQICVEQGLLKRKKGQEKWTFGTSACFHGWNSVLRHSVSRFSASFLHKCSHLCYLPAAEGR